MISQKESFCRMHENVGVLVVVYSGNKDEIDKIQKDVEGKTNLEVMQEMSMSEFSILMKDMQHYDDPCYEWQSKIQPPLPFESWNDWLYKKAEYTCREVEDDINE